MHFIREILFNCQVIHSFCAVESIKYFFILRSYNDDEMWFFFDSRAKVLTCDGFMFLSSLAIVDFVDTLQMHGSVIDMFIVMLLCFFFLISFVINYGAIMDIIYIIFFMNVMSNHKLWIAKLERRISR